MEKRKRGGSREDEEGVGTEKRKRGWGAEKRKRGWGRRRGRGGGGGEPQRPPDALPALIMTARYPVSLYNDTFPGSSYN